MLKYDLNTNIYFLLIKGEKKEDLDTKNND